MVARIDTIQSDSIDRSGLVTMRLTAIHCGLHETAEDWVSTSIVASPALLFDYADGFVPAAVIPLQQRQIHVPTKLT